LILAGTAVSEVERRNKKRGRVGTGEAEADTVQRMWICGGEMWTRRWCEGDIAAGDILGCEHDVKSGHDLSWYVAWLNYLV
jgi:hypothetical protein